MVIQVGDPLITQKRVPSKNNLRFFPPSFFTHNRATKMHLAPCRTEKIQGDLKLSSLERLTKLAPLVLFFTACNETKEKRGKHPPKKKTKHLANISKSRKLLQRNAGSASFARFHSTLVWLDIWHTVRNHQRPWGHLTSLPSGRNFTCFRSRRFRSRCHFGTQQILSMYRCISEFWQLFKSIFASLTASITKLEALKMISDSILQIFVPLHFVSSQLSLGLFNRTTWRPTESPFFRALSWSAFRSSIWAEVTATWPKNFWDAHICHTEGKCFKWNIPKSTSSKNNDTPKFVVWYSHIYSLIQ